MATIAPPRTAKDGRPSERYEALVLDFLAHLEFERGLSRNTLAAYRTDLLQFGRSPSAAATRPAPSRTTYPTSWRTWRRATAMAACPARRPPSIARRPACARSTGTCAARRRSRTTRRRGWRPRGGAGSPEVLSYAEVQRLLAQPRGDDLTTFRDRALLELMYASGLRASETIGLEIRDVDLEQEWSGARQGIEGAARAGRRQGRRGRQGLSAPGRPKLVHSPEERKLFLNFRGGPLTRQGLYKIVLRHAESAGLGDRMSPHTLRHSFATHLLTGDATCALSRRCWDMPTSSTTQLYTHLG